jgi:two-component system chemotaxis response regulator CheY
MKKRVLIVDDFGSMRRMLRAALKPMANLEIHEADHGLSAWDKLQTAPHDLLISDICMPHLDGWELVQRVRESEHHPGLPIILVSAEPAPVLLPPSLRYLGKPFKPALLRNAVAEFLQTEVKADPAS